MNRARENGTSLRSSLTWLEVQFQARSVDSKLRAPVVGICCLTGTQGPAMSWPVYLAVLHRIKPDSQVIQ